MIRPWLTWDQLDIKVGADDSLTASVMLSRSLPGWRWALCYCPAGEWCCQACRLLMHCIQKQLFEQPIQPALHFNPSSQIYNNLIYDVWGAGLGVRLGCASCSQAVAPASARPESSRASLCSLEVLF